MWLPTSNNSQKGFTLVELIIVLALMTIVISVSISSFLAFNTSQTLQIAELGVVNVLQQAKSEAESQVNPCTASQSLDGYQVTLLTGATTYELDVVCSGIVTLVSTKKLAANLSFTGSTPQTFFFKTLQNGVSSTTNTITIQNQASNTKTITIDQLGNIHY